MDQQIRNITPNYHEIYKDIMLEKFGVIKGECLSILAKQTLTSLDVIQLNNEIFGKPLERRRVNQKYRSYNKSDIFVILEYQNKFNLNNSELAKHFNLSRNTIAKWKKMSLI